MSIRNHRYIEHGTCAGIEWVRIHGTTPKGLVILPPLIGGHALYQLRMFNPLVREKLDLMSYNYAGHGASEGPFSLRAAVDNSFIAVEFAMAQGRKEGLPVFGLASCFGSLPLIQALERIGESLSKVALINALPHLRWEKMVVEFCRYWRSSRLRRPAILNLNAVLHAYRAELLPHVSHKRHAFGILSRHRVDWIRSLQDLITFRTLKGASLHSTPVLCIYGRQDRFLRQFGASNWTAYESLIKKICPEVGFLCVNGDHFLRGKNLRRRLLAVVAQFFTLPLNHRYYPLKGL